jgi:ABC-2 type transport system ATP-binding protein
MPPILEIKNLKKVFSINPGRAARKSGGPKTVTAVDGINFTVNEGEIFGLLGPNGAGKTTTIGILTTRITPTEGTGFIAGIDVAREPIRAKQIIAVVPQKMNLDLSLKVRENLTFHAAYFGMAKKTREERADEMLEWLQLKDRANDRIDRLSGGMTQRVMIARALMHDPKILFLDEATVGLDPQSRLLIWEKIKDLNRKGLTIILTTHHMEEADELCQRVAVIDHGKIIALDTPGNLKKMIPGGEVIEMHLASNNEPLLTTLKAIPEVERVEPLNGMVRLYVTPGSKLLTRLVSIVEDHQCELLDVRVSHPTLENVFIFLTGKGLRE